MSNIIKFPNNNKRKKITDVLVDRLTDHHDHVDLGRIPFTCAECHDSVVFDFTNAIFKDVSFYCAGCGHGYRITNPMFNRALKVVKSSNR
jgi:hypothetical protein